MQSFANCSGLGGSLTLPTSLTNLGDSAFQNCTGLNGTLTIPSGLTFGGGSYITNCVFTHVIISYNPASPVINSNYQFINSGIASGCTLVINSGITTIGNSAFLSCSNFSGSLTIPDTVTTIGVNSFASNSFFRGSLTLSSSLTFIGNGAFQNCYFNGPLIIPNSVTGLDQYAFNGCPNFNSITLPSGISITAPSTFANCTGVKSITVSVNPSNTVINSTFTNIQVGSNLTINPGITTINASAFLNSTNFNGSLNIPNGITITDVSSFSGCAFKSVFVTPSVNPLNTTIGSTFQYLNSGILSSSLNIYDGATAISANAFSGSSKFTGSLSLTGGLTIGAGAFSSCKFGAVSIYKSLNPSYNYVGSSYTNLSSGILNSALNIANAITDISANAFLNCSNFVGNLYLYSSVRTIGASAFSGCSGFTGTLSIPSGINSIGNSAFFSCRFKGLQILPNSLPPPITDTLVISSAYNNLKDLSNCTLTIWNGIVDISDNAFLNCSGFIGDLGLYSSITIIGQNAFSGCSGFNGALCIPSGMKSIGNNAFLSCRFSGVQIGPNDMHPSITDGLVIGSTYNNLKDLSNCTLTIWNGIVDISDNAFLNCSGFVGNLGLYSSITTIGQNAFSGCSGFNGTLFIPSGLQLIGANACYGCQFVGLVITPNDSHPPIQNGLIVSSTYNNLKDLSNCTLTVGNLITGISDNAFLNCSGFIGSLTLYSSITTVGQNAFSGCSGLNGTLTMSSGLQLIDTNAFLSCRFTGVQIGLNDSYPTFTDSSIISSTYNNLIDLSNCTLTIGYGITDIGNNAFLNCSGFIGQLNIPPSVTGTLASPGIGAYAFAYCTGFSSLFVWVPPTVIDPTAFYGTTVYP